MIPSLSQEALTQYASDAQTIQQPQGADYSQGVKAGRTIPAKWWNWLFSNVTKRIVQSRNDADNMLTEMKNVVTNAGLTPTASDNTQLTQAIQTKADAQIDKFIESKQSFYSTWEVVDTQGVLPQSTSTESYYKFDNIHKINGVYFAINRTYNLSGGNYSNVNNALAFSEDLKTWHLLQGSDFGKANINTTPQFGVGMCYFKGYWYLLFVGTYQSGGASLYYTIVKLADLNEPSSYTTIRSNTETLQNYSNFQIGTLGDEVFYIKTTIANSIDVSTDGATFSTVSLNAVHYASFGTYADWLAFDGIKLGSSFVVGDFVASADGATWRCYNTLASEQRIAKPLAGKFNGGVVTKGTAYFLASENADAVLVGGASYTFDRFTYDNRYMFLRSGATRYVTADCVNALPLSTELSFAYGTRIDSINGVYYGAFGSDKQIYSSPDLQNWTPTGKYLPTGASALGVVSEADVFVSGTKCSRDLGTTWVQSKDSTGQDYCPIDIDVVEDNRLYAITRTVYTPVSRLKLCYSTSRSFNYVMGHTLYLR